MTVEQLAEQVKNGNDVDSTSASQTLASMGRDALPATMALVLNVGEEHRGGEWCVSALEDLGPPRAEDVDDLIQMLDYGVEDSVYWAATLLGRAGPAAVAAVERLAATANISPETARKFPEQPFAERAAWALGKIGPAAADALPLLRELANSPAPRLARMARQAVNAISG